MQLITQDNDGNLVLIDELSSEVPKQLSANIESIITDQILAYMEDDFNKGMKFLVELKLLTKQRFDMTADPISERWFTIIEALFPKTEDLLSEVGIKNMNQFLNYMDVLEDAQIPEYTRWIKALLLQRNYSFKTHRKTTTDVYLNQFISKLIQSERLDGMEMKNSNIFRLS